MKNGLLIFVMVLAVGVVNAQTEFTLQASELVPHEEGFFRAGVTYDFDGDGSDDFVNGCPSIDFDTEDYERRDPSNVTYDLHIESGEQLGFKYQNTMILPVCDGKYEDDSLAQEISKGFIQLRPGIDTSDVDLAHSYIISPEVRNIQSISVEVSADVSIQDSRHIPFNIEVSTDGGETFLFEPYVYDAIDDNQYRSGYAATYDESDTGMDEIIALSKTQNVFIRLITNPDLSSLGPAKGQYLKVHKFTIVADSAENTGGGGTLSNFDVQKSNIYLKDGYIGVRQGELSVYKLSGRLIGAGSEVKVEKGLYLIVTSELECKKIFIR